MKGKFYFWVFFFTEHHHLCHGDAVDAAHHVGHDLGDHGRAHPASVHHHNVVGVHYRLGLESHRYIRRFKSEVVISHLFYEK